MAVARFLFRVAFRARWRAWTAIALVAGIAGGVVMAAVAGARRTDSAPERVVAETRGADALVNPNNGSLTDAQWHALETRPEVAKWARVEAPAMVPLLSDGRPDIGFLGRPSELSCSPTLTETSCTRSTEPRSSRDAFPNGRTRPES